jgi:hypothetical protein
VPDVRRASVHPGVSRRTPSVPGAGACRAAGRSARRRTTPAAARCHARVACVLGPEHRHPDDALAYHQRRAREPLLRLSRS